MAIDPDPITPEHTPTPEGEGDQDPARRPPPVIVLPPLLPPLPAMPMPQPAPAAPAPAPNSPPQPPQPPPLNQITIVYERWSAIVDLRTCAACGRLHDTIWPRGEGPQPPLHDRCRCTRKYHYTKTVTMP